MRTPIVQFGTSRFLQAHVDLFVSAALPAGDAVGPITVVQTTASPDSARRVAAFNAPGGFPVRIRGLEDGAVVDRTELVTSVARAFAIRDDWDAVAAIVAEEATVIVSNTGDRGYEADPADRPDGAVPNGFPAKLAKLLHARWRHRAAPIDLYPCELVTDNGAVLREAVLTVARGWGMAPAYLAWLAGQCRWVNSLVDRIVSEPLDPIGAVAEPYALWAIGVQPGLVPPVRHAQVLPTDDLARHERLKLFILNLGHTVLAGRWLADGRPPAETVREALADPAMLALLDRVYDDEVLPVFAALGMGDEAAAYRRVTVERFRNPFLDHRLADIAANHAAKTERRIGAFVGLARGVAPERDQPVLRGMLG